MVADVAATVKTIRKAIGLSATELAARTAIGKPMTRAVISDLETGRKKTLEVSELVTLAAALGISPMGLLFPDVNKDVEILPGQTIIGMQAFEWFSGTGDSAPEGVSVDTQLNQSTQTAHQLVMIARALRGQQRRLANAERDQKMPSSLPEALRNQADRELSDARDSVRELEKDLDFLIKEYVPANSGRYLRPFKPEEYAEDETDA